ncbi:MAG: heme biosynthesis HemY N-terminal domain-containing protein [Rubrivivax sp.]
MRGVVWLVLLFVVAVVAATVLGENDGLVAVSWGHWRLDFSLNLVLVLLVLAGLLVWAVGRGLDALWSLPRRAREWRSLQRERAANNAFREALGHYFSGRFSRAQKAARRSLELQQAYPDLELPADHTALCLVLVAGSLHRLQDRGGRDDTLARLRAMPMLAANRSAQEGALLQAAEWALEDADAAQAQQYLDALPAGAARRAQALRLRMRAARLDKRSLQALELARLLAKHQAFSVSAAAGLMRALALEHLDAARDAEQLSRQWQLLDPADRADAVVLAHAIKRAAGWRAFELGRQWLAPAWAQLAASTPTDRQRLALALASCAEGAGVDWLERAETATQQYPGDAFLALATGEICAERALWGKALQYLEAAQGASELPPAARRQALRRLAQLASREGDQARADRYAHACAAVVD